MLLSLLSLLLPSAMATLNQTIVEDGDNVHCPSADDAVSSCQPANFFTYSVCCGDGNMMCCLRVKQWIWIAGGASTILALVVISGCIVRWCMGIRKKSHQSYDFS